MLIAPLLFGPLAPRVLVPLAPRAHALHMAAALAERELGAIEVVESLFGSVDSRSAYRRASLSEEAVERSTRTHRAAELTYGEFDLPFFFELLQAAEPRPREHFVDIGSGCGRLVLAAAIAYEFGLAAGVELLEDLHVLAQEADAELRSCSAAIGVPVAPCTFVCAEAERALPPLLEGAAPATAVVFCYATCWPSAGPYLTELSCTLAASLAPG